MVMVCKTCLIHFKTGLEHDPLPHSPVELTLSNVSVLVDLIPIQSQHSVQGELAHFKTVVGLKHFRIP